MIKYVFPVVGVLLCLSGFYLDRQMIDFLENSHSATGTVIDLVTDSRDSFAEAPVVRFTLESGRTLTFLSNVYSTPPAYQIGEEVEVLYDPSDPDNSARIDSFFSTRGVPFIFYIVGGTFVFLGSVFMYVSRLERRSSHSFAERHQVRSTRKARRAR